MIGWWLVNLRQYLFDFMLLGPDRPWFWAPRNDSVNDQLSAPMFPRFTASPRNASWKPNLYCWTSLDDLYSRSYFQNNFGFTTISATSTNVMARRSIIGSTYNSVCQLSASAQRTCCADDPEPYKKPHRCPSTSLHSLHRKYLEIHFLLLKYEFFKSQYKLYYT